jgi:DNA-directed RNA polymerase subunit beta'
MEYTAFEAIRIGLASPDMVRRWSYGEVLKPETINYRTLKPEKEGLFCERIFGPAKDWECSCGKYKKISYRGKICDRCGVEVTKSKVRRTRMGHIELAAPVSHIWYFKGIPSRMGILLNISPKILDRVLYYSAYIVTDPGTTPLEYCQVLEEDEYRDMREKFEDDFDAGMGAAAVKQLLMNIDCDKLFLEINEELKDARGQKKAKLLKRLEVVEAFRSSGNRPEWMIIESLPVIPPELRPMVQLDGGRFATSDLNDLYRRVINRNNRLKHLLSINAPEIIVKNEKRMLQECVDALIDNGRRGRAVTGANSRNLKSLSDMLKGKQGRFRQNLLGKRVDYSGRSVIVVGPDLKIYQCGVPKEMALELFSPFIIKKLVNDGAAINIKSAKKMISRQETKVWDALDVVITEHPVLLNRAPTLHRLGIQAFEPILVEGRALRLHPLVCTAYNADFDGDQMAIHVPLSAEAQAEARILMLSANNLLRPQDGKPVNVPTQDMILGSYYLTVMRIGKMEKGAEFVYVEDAGDTDLPVGELVDGDLYVEKRDEAEEKGLKAPYFRPRYAYSTAAEAIMAYNAGDLGLHAPILLRSYKIVGGKREYRLITTTVGRIIFNEPIPQDLGFVDRTDPEQAFDLEINFRVDKKKLGKIIDRCIKKHGFTISAEVLDNIKDLGFRYSTKGAITISIADMTVPDAKRTLIEETEQKVIDIENIYKKGLMTDDERYRSVIHEWEKTTKDVTRALENCLEKHNPIYMMADSGARGSMNQIRQLAGMRGLMANTAGKTIEIPVKSNFREGLTVLEYFTSSRGARKGLADTALRTADSGYLTRRLVDVSQDVIIREHDCGTKEGVIASAVYEMGSEVQSFGTGIEGRYPAKPVTDPKTGELLFGEEHLFEFEDAEVLEAHDIHSVLVRSVTCCDAEYGVCARCYGVNLASGKPVNPGEAVGVIAAQSIGEPGTQLTMRTFHTGGVAGGDITQGLPRVEELFEARKPKKVATLSEISGTVYMEEAKRNQMISISVQDEEGGETKVYTVPHSAGILVKNGQHVDKGEELTSGALNPQDILRIRGVDDDEFGRPGVRNYLLHEVQKVYRQQGVEINDKHIEIVVRQMLKKVRVEDPGATGLLTGSTVDMTAVRRANEKVRQRNAHGECDEMGEPLKEAGYTQLLMGITKASLATESFLSAASFQETTKVLTDAAIKGKVDKLVGLKENVIIGKLIPAGTGLGLYQKFEAETDESIGSESDEYVDLSVLVSRTNVI